MKHEGMPYTNLLHWIKVYRQYYIDHIIHSISKTRSVN